MDPKTISPTEGAGQEIERLEAELREHGLLKEPAPEPTDGYTKADIAVLDGIDQGRRRPG
ncbi:MULTISPECIES: hypothetical protein [Methylopilaceae]|uniref:Uncharacterized protein n=1 Tax=Hansschlegelia zhihuaiae TaxID=405005 RepID=A0A4Q0M9V2_9HYPH|nr:hypothetical protein [Hansschlegelia zhihuaiae]RXF69991.1 hypothetical protein EK403_17860 [Hansschlegelia zhihuaiae]